MRHRHLLQKILTAVSLILVLATLLSVGLLLWQTTTSAANPLDSLGTVDAHGTITQNGRRVAVLGINSTITLPLVNPDTTTVAVPVTLTLTFLTPHASTHVTPRIISIQGASAVSYSWVNDTTLKVSSGLYAPDSYTALRLQSDAAFFQPTPAWYVQDILRSISFETGSIIGLCAVLLVIGMMLWVTRRPLWKATDTQNTPPARLTPIQLAILHHSSIEPVDFTAFLIFLAGRGYLQIVEQANDVIFLRTGLQDGLAPHEIGLLQVLFPRENEPSRLSLLIKNLNNELFSAVVSQLYVEIYNTLNMDQFFTQNPREAHLRFKTIGILLQFEGLLLVLMAAWFHALYPALLPLGVALCGSGMYVYRQARHVIPFAPVAAVYIAQCAAFTNYLSLPHPIGPEGDETALFYTYLPYAITGQVEEEWAQRFASSRAYIPQWYVSDQENIMEPIVFVERVQQIALKLAELMVLVKDPNAD